MAEDNAQLDNDDTRWFVTSRVDSAQEHVAATLTVVLILQSPHEIQLFPSYIAPWFLKPADSEADLP